MRLLNISKSVLAAAIAIVPSAAEQSCDRYAALKRLPDRFEEVASGVLAGGLELFVLTDGTCTCDNTPVVDRMRGKPPPQNVNWSYRKATPDERRND